MLLESINIFWLQVAFFSPTMPASAQIKGIKSQWVTENCFVLFPPQLRTSGPMLLISRNVRLSVRVSVRLFVCVFTFEVPFQRLFAPTSRSRTSNILRDSESLQKSNGKKWSQIWTFLFENCLKSPRKKKFFFFFFSLLRYRLTVFLLPVSKVGCPIFLEIRNS
jgi:hypothetical protein